MGRSRRWAAGAVALACAACVAVGTAAAVPARARTAVPSFAVTGTAVAPGSDTAWAVGDEYGATSTSGVDGFVWTSSGGAWTAVRGVPTVAGAGFSAVDAPSAHDVWVAGSVHGVSGATSFFLAWDGHSWHRVGRQNPPSPPPLADITGTLRLEIDEHGTHRYTLSYDL